MKDNIKTKAWNKWRKEEVDALQKLYEHLSYKEIALLTGRSEQAVRGAISYRVKRVKEQFKVKPKPWTNDEIDFIKRYTPVKGNEWVATQLGRTKTSIEHKVSRLGIKTTTKPVDKIEGETWKLYPEIPTYQVSTLGRVKNGHSLLIKRANSKQGYDRLTLSHNGKRIEIALHRMVARTFLGEIPEGYEVNHIDGNKTNNALSNLEIVSQQDNIKHYRTMLNSFRGEKVNTAKLTAEQVREIRRRATMGEKTKTLLKDFPVSKTTMNRIISGKYWKHIA